MIILGITGGSGCGKTTISEIFSRNGVDIIDCDKVARKIVEPDQPALAEIDAVFGNGYIKPDGTLDRKKMANLVFNSPENLLKLNEITHKYVAQYIDLYIKNSNSDIVAIDAAALIESGIYKKCDYVLSVLAEKSVRLERIMNRDNLSLDEATSRINAQKSDNFYVEKSDYIIYNNDDLDKTNEQITKILNEIKGA